MGSSRRRHLIRAFLIELLLYAVLVVIYFFAVLRWLGEPLVAIFRTNLPLYAIAALVLIVVQGVVLEMVTSFLVARIGLSKR